MSKKRRREKKKKEKPRPGRAGPVYVGIMVLLAVACIILACTVFFRVEDIETEGIARYSREEVLAASGVEMGANLILTPSDQVENRVLKALPYVDTIEAKKRFPTTLRLEIVEAQPVAVISGAMLIQPNEEQQRENMEPTVEPTGELWIIDDKGKLLEKTDETGAEEYIKVTGLLAMNPVQGQTIQVQSGDQGRLTALLGLLQALERYDMTGQITAIDATLGTEIAMVYEGRVTVKLLNTTDFDRKMRAFKMVAALLHDYDRGVLNMKSDKVFFAPDT